MTLEQVKVVLKFDDFNRLVNWNSASEENFRIDHKYVFLTNVKAELECLVSMGVISKHDARSVESWFHSYTNGQIPKFSIA